MAKFAVIKSLISQDTSTLRGILWWEIRAILWQLRRDGEEILCDYKEIGRINKCGHITRWRFNLSLLCAKICRGGVVSVIKFVVLGETCAVALWRS